MSVTDRTLLLHLFSESKAIDFPVLADSDYFELFSPFHFLKNYDLDYSDIEEGIVDGPQDGGVDAVYCLCDGRLIAEVDTSALRRDADVNLFVFSTKFIDSFKTNVINDIRATLSDLCTLDDVSFASTSSNYRAAIVERFEHFREFYRRVASRFPRLSIHVMYVTASSTAAPVEVTSRLEIVEGELHEQFSSATIVARAIDARSLLERVRQHPEEVRPLTISGSSISNPRGPSYTILAKLSDYYQFVSRKDGSVEARLFEDNVRDYEGDVEVNSEIASSLSSTDGPDFWWLNNGVSIICESATLSGNILQIRNPKIVNGLQTSRQIHKHFSMQPGTLDDRLVLVRVISANDDATRSAIIRATNRQTPILPAQLVATSTLHRDIELFLKHHGMYYERRKNFWKNQGKPRSEIISITDIAQAVVASVAGRPQTARARPGFILKESGANNIVFNDGYDPRLYMKAIRLVQDTDILIQGVIPDCGRRDRNNIKFQIVAKIVSDSTGGRFDPAVFTHVKFIPEAKQIKIVNAAFTLYKALGGNDAVAKSEEFWVRLKGLKV